MESNKYLYEFGRLPALLGDFLPEFGVGENGLDPVAIPLELLALGRLPLDAWRQWIRRGGGGVECILETGRRDRVRRCG